LKQLPYALSGLYAKLRCTRVGQIWRNVEQRLTLIIKVRRQHFFPRVLHSEAPSYVFETAAHGQRGRCQHGCFELRPKTLSQNGANVNWRGLHRDVHLFASGAPTLDTSRSEEHTSELQSPYDLVCRLLLEKKKA